MLPTGIQPYIINVVNNSTTTAYPVVILDAYDTLAYTNDNLFVWNNNFLIRNMRKKHSN